LFSTTTAVSVAALVMTDSEEPTAEDRNESAGDEQASAEAEEQAMDSAGTDSAASKKPGWPEQLKAIGIILVLLGIVSLITSAVFTSGKGKKVDVALDANGGTIGPIKTKRANTVLAIEVQQALPSDGWVFVDGEVLDGDEEYLFGFGDELWRESGYDEGRWTESKNDFDIKITLPEAGTYYLDLKTEAKPAATQPLRVKVQPIVGSTIPHFVLGMFSLLFGFVLFRYAARTLEREATADVGYTT
jgi:hypothetical protein